jgi:hypothetical protein
VLLLQQFDVNDPSRVVEAETLLLADLPVLRRLDRRLDIVGDGVVVVLGDLGEQAVAIDENAAGLGLVNNPFLEGRIHPDAAADFLDVVKAEELIGFFIVANAVVGEEIPEAEILVPVAELHVEAAVDGPVVHLIVKALAVRHRATPSVAIWRDGRHVMSLPRLGQPSTLTISPTVTLKEGGLLRYAT